MQPALNLIGNQSCVLADLAADLVQWRLLCSPVGEDQSGGRHREDQKSGESRFAEP
jgi:hypothetical protein